MPKLTDISPEVSAKYVVDANGKFALSQVKNAELDKYTGEPKDDIKVEVGDTKQIDFYPQVKIARWSNEVNFSVRLIDNDTNKTAQVSTLQDKIIWEKGNISVKFYDIIDGDGGYEFQIDLKEKPTSNKIEFTLNDKGVEYYYQPPVTSFIGKMDVVTATETDGYDADGKRIIHCEDNIPGSYEVVMSEKKWNISGGKIYKTGKVGHIYRPKIIDSIGDWAWGELYIENGLLTVTIPQGFLDKAVYPIKHAAGLYFGYGDSGSFSSAPAANTLYGSYFTFPATAGQSADSITAYLNKASAGTAYFKGILTTSSDDHIISNGVSAPSTGFSTTLGWVTANYSPKPTLSASTGYEIAMIPNSDLAEFRWSNSGANRWYDTSNSYATPTNPTDGSFNSNVKYSIYCTYSATGSGTAYSVSVTESGSGGGAGLVLVDATGAPRAFFRKLNTDSISLSEVFSVGKRAIQQIIDTITLSEPALAIKSFFRRNITDAAQLSDIVSQNGFFRKQVTDSFSLAVVFSKATRFLGAIVDQIILSEQALAIKSFFRNAVQDTITLVESLVATMVHIGTSFSVAITDVVKISADTFVEYFETITEAITMSEQALAVKAFFRKSIQDAVTLIENLTATMVHTGNVFLVTIVDVVKISADVVSNYFEIITEAITLSDPVVTVSAFLRQLVEDTISLADSLVQTIRYNLSLVSDLLLTDVSTITAFFRKQLSDTVSLEEAFSALKIFFVTILESISISEVALTIKTFFTTIIVETITFVETVVVTSTAQIWKWITKNVSAWINQSKNTAIWTNQNKNTSVWTNQNKNSAAWANQSKNTSAWTFQDKS